MGDATRNVAATCILVVEDHADTLKLMVRLLEQQGYKVIPAHSFDDAKKSAEQCKCDLLVSDLVLDGRDGFELMRDLRSRYGLRGIAVSGRVFEQNRREAKEAGFEIFVAKPFEFDELLTAIESMTE